MSKVKQIKPSKKSKEETESEGEETESEGEETESEGEEEEPEKEQKLKVELKGKSEYDLLNEYEMWSLKNIHNTNIDKKNFNVWENPLLMKFKVQEKEIIRALTENTSLIEMKDRKCNYCGNNRFHVNIIQARSADEGATTVFECSQCGKRQAQNA